MDRKEILLMCMESPLYFTMSLKNRLEFLKQHEKLTAPNDLRQDLLSWVKTGSYSSNSKRGD